MPFFSVVAPLVLAGSVLANPLAARGNDACAAVVTGKAALADESLRSAHCKSYLNVVVTPAPKVVTVTLTGEVADATSSASWGEWDEEEDPVTVCPNQVPDYASACDDAAYKTACGAYAKETTSTASAGTTTKTVVVQGTCSATKGSTTTTAKATTTVKATSTVTVTTTKATTHTTSGLCLSTPSVEKCLQDDDVEYFIKSFTDFLENTNAQGGNGFNTALAQKVLADDFTDWSDSINYMTKFSAQPIPLGSVTFPSKQAFIGAQGSQPQVKVTTLHSWHSCKTISWNWQLVPQLPPAVFPNILPVKGISVLEITDDLKQIHTNYAEFDNGAWLAGLNLPECKNATTSKRSLDF